MKNITRTIAIFAIALSLAACGGGGSSGPDQDEAKVAFLVDRQRDLMDLIEGAETSGQRELLIAEWNENALEIVALGGTADCGSPKGNPDYGPCKGEWIKITSPYQE